MLTLNTDLLDYELSFGKVGSLTGLLDAARRGVCELGVGLTETSEGGFFAGYRSR